MDYVNLLNSSPIGVPIGSTYRKFIFGWDDAISGGIGAIGSIIGGNAQAEAQKYVAELNYKSQKETNEANRAMNDATNKMNQLIAQQTNKANYDLYKEQNRDSVNFWNMQNAYNDPSAEVARLSAAGVNPAMAFGQGNSAGAIQLGSASPMVGATMQKSVDVAPQYSDYAASMIPNFATLLSSLAGYRKTSAEAKGIETSNQYADAMNQVQLEDMQAALKLKLSQKDLSDEQRKQVTEALRGISIQNDVLERSKNDVLLGYQLDNAVKQGQQKLLEEQAADVRLSASLKEAQKLFTIADNSRQWLSLHKNLQKMDAEMRLMASQGVLNAYQASNVYFDTVGKAMSNEQASQLWPFIKKQYEDDGIIKSVEAFKARSSRYDPFNIIPNIANSLPSFESTVLKHLFKK